MADKFLWQISIGWNGAVEVVSFGANGVEEFTAIGDVHNLANLQQRSIGNSWSIGCWNGKGRRREREREKEKLRGNLRSVEIVVDRHSVPMRMEMMARRQRVTSRDSWRASLHLSSGSSIQAAILTSRHRLLAHCKPTTRVNQRLIHDRLARHQNSTTRRSHKKNSQQESQKLPNARCILNRTQRIFQTLQQFQSHEWWTLLLPPPPPPLLPFLSPPHTRLTLLVKRIFQNPRRPAFEYLTRIERIMASTAASGNNSQHLIRDWHRAIIQVKPHNARLVLHNETGLKWPLKSIKVCYDVWPT